MCIDGVAVVCRGWVSLSVVGGGGEGWGEAGGRPCLCNRTIPSRSSQSTPQHNPHTNTRKHSPELVEVSALGRVRDEVLARKERFLDLVMEDILQVLYLRLGALGVPFRVWGGSWYICVYISVCVYMCKCVGLV